MYYLEQKHPEYEYTLYVQQASACPYTICVLNSFEQVLDKIEHIEKQHCYYWNRDFYIDNDFYNNKQERTPTGTYYKFLRRKVNDWEDFTTKDEIGKCTNGSTYLRLVTQM